MNKQKIVIKPTGDKVLVGSHFHELKDETVATYETDNIPVFFKYLEDIGEPAIIYYNLSNVKAMPKESNRYGNALAFLSLQHTPPYMKLANIRGNKMSLDGFEMNLNILKPYMDANGLELLANLRDFKVNRIQKVVRQKDRQTGNYSFQVSQEGAGKDDFTPPAKVKFEVPLFTHIPDTLVADLDFEFSFKANEDEVNLYFILNSIQFPEIVENRHKEILNQYLKTQKCPYYWGDLVTDTHDDSWRYKKNEIS